MTEGLKKLVVGFLYDDTLDSSDGVAQYVKTIGAWLSEQGHRVIYLVGDTKTKNWAGGEVYSLSKNLKLSWGGNRLSMPILARKNLIRKILKQNQLDILHVQVPYSPFMAQKIINRIDPSVAVVSTFHVFPASSLSVFGSKLLKIVYGKSLKRFDRHLSVSAAAQSYTKEVFSISSSVIPNVVDLKKMSAGKTTAKPSAQQIVFLGRLVKRKGAKQLLEAFLILHSRMPEVLLTIAGDGPKRSSLERFVRKNKLREFVKFLGFIDEKSKASLLVGADIACFPSLYGESFGIVLIEAMAAGSGAVLGGDNPGYRSVLGQQPVLLVNPANTDEFARRLEKLLINRKLLWQIHNWQDEHIRQFDIATVGPKLVDIYNQAIANKTQGRHN
ncbi:glycosyltransferase family 4 protein [Candidatus Saccharibacteria bacterium]|nr:glycosyltransferase family 4 protein [Candidatus Saccharibacteria bacterium]